MILYGKKAVVTGASSGIGYAIAKELARRGVEVLAVSRTAPKTKFGDRRIHPMRADLRESGEVDRVIGRALRKLGVIDLFVADAGIAYYGKTRADWSAYEDIFRLNVFSPVYTLTRLCEQVKKHPIHVVAVDSAAGRIPLPGYALYCSTKFALDGFLRAFRFELPANIKLSVVYPVSVDTALYRRAATDTPAPRPVMPVGPTARRIVRGIEEEREEIIPSAVFEALCTASRFFPVLLQLYQQTECIRFGHWLRHHGDRQ